MKCHVCGMFLEEENALKLEDVLLCDMCYEHEADPSHWQYDNDGDLIIE